MFRPDALKPRPGTLLGLCCIAQVVSYIACCIFMHCLPGVDCVGSGTFEDSLSLA